MKIIALRLMAVLAIIVLLGGPAVSANANSGAPITHPSISLRQTLEGTPQVEAVETEPSYNAAENAADTEVPVDVVSTDAPATEPPVEPDWTEPPATDAPVQTDAPVPSMEPVETVPPTIELVETDPLATDVPATEPIATEPSATTEPTQDDGFIFVFCHVSPDGSQETMRISINDPAGATYIVIDAFTGPRLLFPNDYWGECIAQPTQVPPTEQPTQVTEVPTATAAPSQTAQPTATTTAPVETPTPTAVPGSPTPTATTDPGTPSPTATVPATASPTVMETVTVPAATPTTAPTEMTVPVTVTAPANAPTATATMEPSSVSPETPVQPTVPPTTSQPSNNAQAPVQKGSAQSDSSAIDPVTGLPVAGSGPRDPHPENMAIASVLLMTAVALGYSAIRARRRGI